MAETAKRIISLVPSLTELLFDLGLSNEVAGRTRFCIHPEDEVESVKIIGGTKNPDLDKIRELQPDLIIANREENRKEDVEALMSEFNLLLTDINTIEDAFLAIHDIGEATGKTNQALKLIQDCQFELDQINFEHELNVAYFIWRQPWMVAASGTYIDDVLERWGLKNVYSDVNRYPEVDESDLKRRYPDLILLSSEPYPFKEKHIQELKEFCPAADIQLVNGEWFSWYGSRMLPSFRSLNEWRSRL
jgi:ABC-type Fe3+-hydroxamate transport system substrate-binding protein